MLVKNNSFLILLFAGIIILMTEVVYAQPITAPLVSPVVVEASDRVENRKGETVLVFTPHPDDETFSMAGTLARLVENGNTVHIIIYTNDNRGSQDLEMTRERLARIRRAEEEKACDILGIPSENLHWLGYEDGDLEYADPKVLRGKIARFLKIYRPDAVFCPDPGTKWVQWHKTDHRMAANITRDAFIAADWHLYYPQHLLDEGLKPFFVKEVYYYYSQAPNYEVDITTKMDLKVKASAAHVSQFEPSVNKYTPIMPQETFDGINERFRALNGSDNGTYVERFRRTIR